MTTGALSTTLEIVSSRISSAIHSSSVQQTLDAGERLGEKLLADFPEGVVVLLIGPLGAGKTVIAKGIARGLGIRDQIVSPTYTIISQYSSGRILLHHIDLYRIEGTDQMENLGLDDIMRGGGLVVIEWGEKLESALRESLALPYLRIAVSLAEGGARDITVEEVSA